jgi:hypothetical protein
MISYVSSTLQTNMTNTNQMHTFYDLSILILFFPTNQLDCHTGSSDKKSICLFFWPIHLHSHINICILTIT